METIDRPNCPVMRSLKVIGDQWSLLIIRDLLLLGPRRFQDLLVGLGTNPNTLSARLKKLTDAGVIERNFYSDHPPRAEYQLTSAGKKLGPIVKGLREWGEAHTPSIKPD